jgi:hypothetical protein
MCKTLPFRLRLLSFALLAAVLGLAVPARAQEPAADVGSPTPLQGYGLLQYAESDDFQRLLRDYLGEP